MATRAASNSFHRQQEDAWRQRQVLRISARLLFWGSLLLLWLLALVSYSPWDAAFSTSGDDAPVRNLLGAYGAWLADLSYYFLGFSTWFLFVAMVFACLVDVRRLLRVRAQMLAAAAVASLGQEAQAALTPNRPISTFRGWKFALGLCFWLAASCALEWSRLHRLDAALPGPSGGVLGLVLGAQSETYMGFDGAALFWVTLWVWGLAWCFRFSWLDVAESIGEWCSRRVERVLYQRELAKDVAQGVRAAQERETQLEEARQEARERPSHLAQPHAGEAQEASAFSFDAPRAERSERTEPALTLPVTAPPVLVEPSPRVQQEKQTALFSELQEQLPPVHLLDAPVAHPETVAPETLEMTSRLIEKKLKDFGVSVSVVAASPGPVITRYEIEPATGVKGSQVVNLAKDLARSLSLVSIRVIETIPGKNYMALELPNAKRQTIRLSEIIGSNIYHQSKSLLTLALGKDIVGLPVVIDLAKMPHLLVAGTTGSGKSVGINAMILSLLYKAELNQVRLMLIDPKMLEMSVYEGIPHLLCPVVTDMRQAGNGLNWCVGEMERRYKLMSKMGVRNLAGYNHKISEAKARGELLPNPFSLTPESPEPLDLLPHIVIVIDELADLMMVVGKKIEELIARLAQKARAAGIHLVLATQRPSVDVITGLIKANVPSRIAFQVSSKIDSRTILDQMGAEALLGMGDMLYMPIGAGVPTRVHGAFVSDEEVHRVVNHLKQFGEPNYIEGILEGGTVDGEDGNAAEGGAGSGENDPMYDNAVAVVLKQGKATTSLIQRHLQIGYGRAARILEEMENAGLVSKMDHRNQRQLLAPRSGGDEE